MRPADAQRLLHALAGVDAPVGFAVFDANHRYVAVNDVMAARLGRSIADHLGCTPAEILPAAMAQHADEMIERVLRTGESVEVEEPAFDADGGGKQPAGRVRASWYVIDEGRGREVAMFVIDDTTQQRAVSALRHSRARNARLLEVAGELAQAVTPQQVVAAVDSLARRVLGASRVGLEQTGGKWAVWPRGMKTPVSEVDETGWPIFVHNREQAVTNYPEPAFAQFIGDSGDHAWAVLPLLGNSRHLGVLWLAYRDEQVFEPERCRFLRAVAQQCSVALERAELFEQERAAADSLSEGLQPTRLPEVDGVDLVAYYMGGTARHAIGGDWYDAIGLSSGELALVVGDVMGHGLAAAPGMGQLRAALRALALANAGPAEVLTGLDRFVERGDSAEMATVVYTVLDPATGRMRVGDAGHLPLVRIPAQGQIELIDAGAGTTPIGVSEPRYSQDLQLSRGDIVVAFTDGLVETRDRSLEDGVRELLESLDAHRGAPLDVMVSAAIERLGVSRSSDDVTILALRWIGT